jgi:hypothetical protein
LSEATFLVCRELFVSIPAVAIGLAVELGG